MDLLALYVRLVGAQLRGQMQYKVSFLLALVGSFLLSVTDFGVIAVERLEKTFRVAERRTGLLGAVTSLVHREYRAVHAVRDVSFRIERAEMVGCLGPNGAGKSTTHDMSDVEQLCSRVLIIDRGTLLYDGTLDRIRDQLGTERTLVIDLAHDVPSEVSVRGATQVRADGPRRWLPFNRLETTAAELIAEVAAGYPLRDLTIEEPHIETIVRRIYERGLEPTSASIVTS